MKLRGVSPVMETDVTEAIKKPFWKRLLAFWPVLVVLAIFMAARSPLAASPDEPPASAKGAIYELDFSPL